MIQETTTLLSGEDVIERAKIFFAERVPHQSVFLEHEGPSHATFRGQGGEEIAMAIVESNAGGSRVRASTLMFDQVVGRFFSTLPPVAGTKE